LVIIFPFTVPDGRTDTRHHSCSCSQTEGKEGNSASKSDTPRKTLYEESDVDAHHQISNDWETLACRPEFKTVSVAGDLRLNKVLNWHGTNIA
jgi:hypothetical protein